MRRFIQWTFVPVAVVALAACGKRGNQTQTAMNADLQRDLKLASSTQTLQINPDEIAPQSHQDLAVRPKEAPSGPRAIRSEHPTVKASAKTSAKATEVAEIQTHVPQVEVMASAPAPSETPTPDAPPLARPSPVPAQTYPTSERIPDNAGSSGGILGGIVGAVIRGGMIGDDDHCDPRGPHRGAGRPIGGGVYGTGGGILGGIFGGMAGGRMPQGRP